MKKVLEGNIGIHHVIMNELNICSLVYDLSFCCKQKYFAAGLLITFRQDDITILKWMMIWFETR